MPSALLENDVRRKTQRSTVRILHVINGEHYAGAERVQDTLALVLPDHGYQLGFACLKPRQFASARRARQAPVYELAMHGRLDWSPVKRLTRLIREGEYELVHTHTPRTALIGAAAAQAAGVPLVHHIHCQTSVEVGVRRWQDRLNLLVERLATYRASKVLAVSASLYRYLLRRGYSARQLKLTPNGVPVSEQSQHSKRIGEVPTVGFVAFFRPRKGLEVLIRALAILRADDHPVRLRAVGCFESADYEQQIKSLAMKENVDDLIDWRGFRTDVAAELTHLDALVLPSLICEAMPMSILEAMAAGVAVVGSRVDGITDLIDDGVDGLLTRPGDARDLAGAIRKATTGDAEMSELRSRAVEKQRTYYSDRSMAAGVAEVYREVLHR